MTESLPLLNGRYTKISSAGHPGASRQVSCVVGGGDARPQCLRRGWDAVAERESLGRDWLGRAPSMEGEWTKGSIGLY